MSVIVRGREIKPKRKVTVQIAITKFISIVMLIVIPIYLFSLGYVFYQGRIRLNAKGDCLVLVVPPLTPTGDISPVVLQRAEGAIELYRRNRRKMRGIIVTGFEGNFDEKVVSAVDLKIRKEYIDPREVVYTRQMENLDDMAMEVVRLMKEKKLGSGVIIAKYCSLAKMLLVFKRASSVVQADIDFEGFPIEEEGTAKGDENIFFEALRFIFLALTDFPEAPQEIAAGA